MRRTRQAFGFSLLELLAVIAIIAVLAAILLPAIHMMREASMRRATEAEIQKLSMALEGYKQKTGAFPADALDDYDINGTPGNYWPNQASLNADNMVARLQAERLFQFDPERLDGNRYYDPFRDGAAGYYRYDVIKKGRKVIILSTGPNLQFDGFGASDGDDITNVDRNDPTK